jgi:hypothetical protein
LTNHFRSSESLLPALNNGAGSHQICPPLKVDPPSRCRDRDGSCGGFTGFGQAHYLRPPEQLSCTCQVPSRDLTKPYWLATAGLPKISGWTAGLTRLGLHGTTDPPREVAAGPCHPCQQQKRCREAQRGGDDATEALSVMAVFLALPMPLFAS